MSAAQVLDLPQQAEDQPTVRDMLRDAFATGEADPRGAVRKVLPLLTEQDRADLVQTGLLYLAREVIRDGRIVHPDPAPEPTAGGSKRWGQAAKDASDPLTWRVSVNGREDGWKLLGECTVPEVRAVSEMYMLRARQNKARADRFRVLADEMSKAAAARVTDLDAELVRRVMTL